MACMQPIVCQLQSHLDECVRTHFMRLWEFSSIVCEVEHSNVQFMHHYVHVLFGFLNVLLDFWCDVESKFLWHRKWNHGSSYRLRSLHIVNNMVHQENNGRSLSRSMFIGEST